ncbi:hypothetical protein BDP81DRAFT_420631 [Colletotrichum phormii]|uniref:Uncharacterized protein n=1 Tax=Colletotrichum phormii TaxID=359342 RepID=A0AAI9ZYT7_9PEZI|nr:uncharacterized protein BDP81DRAFT_420631 [Colletotrichum phormii]KAK1640737.1 hypothetical protein BDP81DRAFT_420631 [Colletotrichum phormii]
MAEMIDHGFSSVKEDVKVSHDLMREVIRSQDQHMTEERKAFLAGILNILTRPDSFNQQSSVLQSEITTHRQEELAFDTQVALLRNPKDLQNAFGSSRRGLNEVKRCRCRTSITIKDRSMRPLKLQMMQKSDHSPGCLYRQSGSVSWSYAVCDSLYPFIRKTMELAMV